LLKWRTKLCKINFMLEWNLRTSYNALRIQTTFVCALEEIFMFAVLCGVTASQSHRKKLNPLSADHVP